MTKGGRGAETSALRVQTHVDWPFKGKNTMAIQVPGGLEPDEIGEVKMEVWGLNLGTEHKCLNRLLLYLCCKSSRNPC